MDKEADIPRISSQAYGQDLQDDREIGPDALRLKRIEKVYR
jgi:hypothetical protein